MYLLALPQLEAAVNSRVALEVEGDRRRGYVCYCIAIGDAGIELESLGIGREKQQAARRQQAHAVVDHPGMVTLHVQHPCHPRGVRKRRRIEEDQVVRGPATRLLGEPGQAVRMQQVVLRTLRSR